MLRRRHALLGSGEYCAAYKLVKQAIEGTGLVLTDVQNAAGDRLVRDLQGEANSAYATLNVWDKLLAVYGLLGGTAATHKFNWKNPVDSNAAFRLSYGGGTHAATGFNPGLSASTTLLVPATAMTLAGGSSLGVYSRTAYSANPSQEGIDMGALNTATQALLLSVHNKNQGGTGDAASNPRSPLIRNLGNLAVGPVGTGLGFFQTSRVQAADGSSTTVLVKNGVQVASTTDAAGTTSLPTGDVWLGALNISGSAYGFAAREYACCYIGHGLTSDELTCLNSAVQAYQTRLGRQV